MDIESGSTKKRKVHVKKSTREHRADSSDSNDSSDDGSSASSSQTPPTKRNPSPQNTLLNNNNSFDPEKGGSSSLDEGGGKNAAMCWNTFKKLCLIAAVAAIALNIWAVKRLKNQFATDHEADLKVFQSVFDSQLQAGNVAIDQPSSSQVSGGSENGLTGLQHADNRASNKVLKIMQLLERTEKELHPPSEDKRRVVLLGKSFIMKRDAEIWDVTFGDAKFRVSQTTKQAMQHDRDEDWSVMLCLDLFDGKSHCMEPADLPSMKRWQRISRLYGLRKILWNKDKFCETMSSALKGYGFNYTEFVFPCWILPHDYDSMIQDVKERYSKKQFILKPTDRGEGNGIIVMDNFRKLPNWKAEFPDNDEVVVQTYLQNPFLINGRKWDMRTYVLVTSIHPLRVYMYRDGLVRFASSRYDADAKDGGKKTAFLTNTSINKKTGVAVDDLTWPYYQVWAYLKQVGVNPDELWTRIERAVVQVLMASEPAFLRRFKSLRNDFMCSNCYQLLGVDVIVDDDLNPRVIEVNGEPSMELSGERNSHYDHTKKSMTHDLVAMIFNTDSFARALTADLYDLELDGMRIGYQGLGTGCTPADEVCLSQVDLEYLIEMKKEEANMNGFRRMYPSKKGDLFYANYAKHLETKLPYGHTTSTNRLHKLITTLAIRSKVVLKNQVDHVDAGMPSSNANSERDDED